MVLGKKLVLIVICPYTWRGEGEGEEGKRRGGGKGDRAR